MLNFKSLSQQTHDKKLSKYGGIKDLAGLLNAIKPNLRLRIVLKTMLDLTMERWIKSLSAYF